MVTTRPSLVEWPYAVVIVLIAVAGCAHEPPRRSGLGVSAPNPNGCYVFLYDRSDWQGAGVVLNGPARWPKLEGLYANQNWRNRIQSVDVGPAATVTVYTDAAFNGLSRRFAPNSKQPRLESDVSARIESLELACRQPTNGAAPK